MVKQEPPKKMNIFQHFKEHPNTMALQRILDSEEFSTSRPNQTVFVNKKKKPKLIKIEKSPEIKPQLIPFF